MAKSIPGHLAEVVTRTAVGETELAKAESRNFTSPPPYYSIAISHRKDLIASRQYIRRRNPTHTPRVK